MLALESHTSACHACGHGLAPEALFCPNCGTAKQRDVSDDPLIGARVGERYLLTERIGMGASGTIYKGEHVTLRRRVCVKVLHHELSRDDLAIERFRRQATTVSDLENEHIVAVHDFGRAPDGRLYIAMEFLEGETLDERIEKKGHLEVDEAVSILTQLGEALIEAHAIGYVHRDLRPRNLFLAVRRGSANFLKLLDFGLSKLVASEGSADSTSLGMTFGDPHYMSPEQARGEPVDRRADIYSMGCIAYQMFTGEPPFTGEKVFNVLSRHVEEQPMPLSARVEAPAWVNAAVMRCLEKNPDDRFATVYRLVESLREGASSGVVMEDARALRRETTQPASVSRVIERFSDRLGADGRMDDADDLRTELGASNTALPALPALPAMPAKPAKKAFDGAQTTLGVGVAETSAAPAAPIPRAAPAAPIPRAAPVVSPVVSPVDGATTEPSSAPIISGETPDAVPSAIPQELTPPPRSRDLPAVVIRAPSGPLGTPQVAVREEPSFEEPSLAAAAGDEDDYIDDDEYDYDDQYLDQPPAAAPEPEPEAEPAAISAPGGKRAKRPSAANESGLGISSAWYADGDALGDSQLSLDEEEMAKLERARAKRVSRAGLSATGEMYYDEEPSKLKWIVGAVGVAAVIGLAIFLLTRGGDKPTGEAAAVASADKTDGAVSASALAGSAVAAVTPDAAPIEVPVEPPVEVKPKDTKPKDAKPKDVKPKDVKPKDVKPKDVKPKDPPEDPKDTKPEDPPEDKTGRPSAEDKKRANFFAQIGSKALARGDIPGAAKEFRRALALNPSNSRAITGLGQIALKQGSYQAAVRHLSRAAKMRSGSAHVHSLLGDAKLGAGDKSGATAAYRKALSIDPDSKRARRGLERLGISG